MSPGVYIIAGPNGAGKTTFAREFLPNCRNFVNADLIAQGVSLFAPEAAAIRAGRLRLEEIDILAGHGLILGSRRALGARPSAFDSPSAEAGYGIHFFYLWVPSVELALSRIRERVHRGGHDIPETVVRRCFERSITNFLVH
jgi:predicted ABC-type ATPase